MIGAVARLLRHLCRLLGLLRAITRDGWSSTSVPGLTPRSKPQDEPIAAHSSELAAAAGLLPTARRSALDQLLGCLDQLLAVDAVLRRYGS